jgi:hypothetical protein
MRIRKHQPNFAQRLIHANLSNTSARIRKGNQSLTSDIGTTYDPQNSEI